MNSLRGCRGPGRVVATIRTVAVVGAVAVALGDLRAGTELVQPATRLIDNVGIAIGARPIGALYPGASQPVNLTISNPSDGPVTVNSLSVTIDDATTRNGAPDPGCDGSTNFAVTHQLVAPHAALVIAAHASRSLADLGVPEDQWPTIHMLDLPTNQDDCKGAVLSLVYSGTA